MHVYGWCVRERVCIYQHTHTHTNASIHKRTRIRTRIREHSHPHLVNIHTTHCVVKKDAATLSSYSDVRNMLPVAVHRARGLLQHGPLLDCLTDPEWHCRHRLVPWHCTRPLPTAWTDLRAAPPADHPAGLTCRHRPARRPTAPRARQSSLAK